MQLGAEVEPEWAAQSGVIGSEVPGTRKKHRTCRSFYALLGSSLAALSFDGIL